MAKPARALVLLLHGVKASGADLDALRAQIAPHLPGVAFEAPDAPFANDQGPSGHQWFSVSGVTARNRAGRVRAARPAFDALVGGLVDRHGLSHDLSRVAFVGYSQGAIMALDALASGRWPVGAVVAMSGRLATRGPLAPPQTTPVLLAHGTADGVVPAAESTRAAARLQAAGVPVTLMLTCGMGHMTDPLSAGTAGLFLARRFAR